MGLSRGGRARGAAHPDKLKLWAQRAAAIRWNPVRAARGLPPLPVPDVAEVQTPGAAKMRRRRALAKRMCEYDGIPYHDAMASSARVRIALEEEADPPRGSA
jgi:hypothetical protein